MRIGWRCSSTSFTRAYRREAIGAPAEAVGSAAPAAEAAQIWTKSRRFMAGRDARRRPEVPARSLRLRGGGARHDEAAAGAVHEELAGGIDDAPLAERDAAPRVDHLALGAHFDSRADRAR